MAATAESLPNSHSRSTWLWQFLKDELAPYRRRTGLVARTVIASTIVMILSMIYKIPYGAFGAIWAFNFAHGSLETTAKEVEGMVIGLLSAGVYIILGQGIALADPILRFIWVTGGFLLAFWGMSAFSRYSAAGRAAI
ncbi:MAG: hypothetical protein JOZ22_23405 [Acidobacteriia bacterium]|nr:hypothetical protein [Terriglobia bacterium]